MSKKTLTQLGVVLLVGLVVFLTLPKNEVPSSGPISQWQTYQSRTDGFTIRYPLGAVIREGASEGLTVEPKLGEAKALFSITFPRVNFTDKNWKQGYYQSYVWVTVAPSSVSDCPKEAKTNPSITSWQDTGINYQLDYTSYRYCYNDMFYEVHDVFSTGGSGLVLTPELASDITATQKRNGAIATSFQFVDSSIPELE